MRRTTFILLAVIIILFMGYLASRTGGGWLAGIDIGLFIVGLLVMANFLVREVK